MLTFAPLLLALGSPALADEGEVVSSGVDADVIVGATLRSSPEALHPLLLDLRIHEQLWPESCTNRWVHGRTHTGLGASATWSYTMGPMRRRLTATLDRFEAPKVVELDHSGNKGFVSRIGLEPAEGGGTIATYSTWLQSPPWPFGKLYTRSVQPVWAECQLGFLENLDKRAQGG